MFLLCQNCIDLSGVFLCLFNRASDDPEKTTTTYTEEPQPTHGKRKKWTRVYSERGADKEARCKEEEEGVSISTQLS